MIKSQIWNWKYYFRNPSRTQISCSPAVVKSDEHSAPDRRARVRGSPGKTPPCALIAFGERKNGRGCNVIQVTVQVMPLLVPKRGSHPLCGSSKLWWHVSGPSLAMSPRSSAIAHFDVITHPSNQQTQISLWGEKHLLGISGFMQ